MKLGQLQAAYRDYLLGGDSTALAPAIVPDAFDASERLAIYRNNFQVSLGEALKANFPVTRQMLGGGFFDEAARRFVLAEPPRQPCLFEFGSAFPDWLGSLPELAALPYAAEVARFEFARIAAYNAPVEEYVSSDLLAGRSPEQLDAMPIRLSRHARILPVQAPVLALWTAHQGLEPDLAGIDMAPRPHALLVCRPDRTLVVRELDSTAARFLSAAGTETRLGLAAAQCGAGDGTSLAHIIGLALALRLMTSPATP